jgi:hypothetical protein
MTRIEPHRDSRKSAKIVLGWSWVTWACGQSAAFGELTAFAQQLVHSRGARRPPLRLVDHGANRRQRPKFGVDNVKPALGAKG